MNTGNRLDNGEKNKKQAKMAIVCLTETGSKLAIKMAVSLDKACDVYIPVRLQSARQIDDCDYYDEKAVSIVYFEKWRDTFTHAFQNYTQLVCIMATGIVVRSIAPLLDSKYVDPAVVVVDEAGQFAISFVSGHVGGANELAKAVAKTVGATAVITTATDVQNKPAVDMLAKQLDAIIEPGNQIKIFNRLLAEGQEVILTSPYPVVEEIKTGFVWANQPPNQLSNQQTSQAQHLPTITISPFRMLECGHEAPRIQMIPRHLVIGIGCRKDTSFDAIRTAVETIIDTFHIHRQSIKSFATIDFKGNEPGVQQVARSWGVPLLTVTKEEIQTLEGQFTPSDWVQKTIGVGGVCEPAARIVAKQGVTIIPKQIVNSVTISVAMERSWWLDWDQGTEIIQHLLL